MAGRKKLPDEQKIIRGTFRKDRENPDVPVVAPDYPVPPAYLSERAKEIFNELAAKIAGMKYATDSHAEMLALCAVSLEEVESYTEIIALSGPTYEYENRQGSVTVNARPEMKLRAEAMRRAQSLLAEFGLSPASKSKVVVSKAAADNPWAGMGAKKAV